MEEDSLKFHKLKIRLENDYQRIIKATDDQINDLKELADTAHRFALTVASLCPQNRELSTALFKIEEAMHWGTAAISRNVYKPE